MADGRQDDSVPLRGVPDDFICAAAERMLALGGVEDYQIVTRYGTPSAYVPLFLRVVESAVLTVGRFTRFAAAEMTGGNRFTVAFMRQQLDKPGLVLDFLVENSR